MKVILKSDVDNLGVIGSIVDVAAGYGRNYLIPRDLAVEANLRNLKKFEHEKALILKKAEKAIGQVKDLASRLSALKLNIEVKAGEDDKLFGSVTNRDIAEAIAKHGLEVDKRKIVLPEELIKRLGTHAIQVKLHPEVTADISLEVTKI